MIDVQQYERTVSSLFAGCLAGLRPPERLPLSEFSEKHVWVDDVMTAGRERFSFDKHAYQREILDSLSDPECQGVYLVAPSRWGKTAVVPNLVAHTVETNPMDIMIVQTSRTNAVTFAKGDLEKFFEANDWFSDKIRPGRTTNSLLMKKFRNGTILSIVWPSAKNLAGVNRGVICLPDYDRAKADVDGEGALVIQAAARAKAYGSRKTIFVDSSPSKNPEKFERFEPESPHQAPPYPGIFSLYNTGDRRWFYWQCVCCNQWFPAHPDHLKHDDQGSNKERAASAYVQCPNTDCGAKYKHDGDRESGMPGKDELNRKGRWVPDGMSLDDNGNLVGKMLNPPVPGVDNYRSYWAFGVTSASQTWEKMVLERLDAEDDYAKSGEDGTLKTVINSNYGLPWIPPHIENGSAWEDYKARALTYAEKEVPPGALYLITTVDTQKYRWEVQTHAFGPEGRCWIIDRHEVKFSDRLHETRLKADNTPERAWVQPGAYLEDWQHLTTALKKLEYPMHDGSGKMVPAIIGVDSGGYGERDGDTVRSVTANAVEWWRNLRGDDIPRSRVMLLKGDPKLRALTEIKHPNGEKRTDRHSGNRGDVPIMHISSNDIKDIVSANLSREVDGPNYVSLPDWAENWWFKELTSEHRSGDKWVKNSQKVRNEAWDLLCYATALNRSVLFQADRIDWFSENLPNWARIGVQNPFFTPTRPVGADGNASSTSANEASEPYLSLEEIGAAYGD
ncbi:terminase gpA endonuclease subunit [Paracoccus yeei]|uniref:terminase gpA endonuclease subunit n=1 Tax=Paracoccus yeei TaxID=147645 RepID=UPI00174E2997|nr:terminase gpA endonuclease subunit [Paracoccus yeei]